MKEVYKKHENTIREFIEEEIIEYIMDELDIKLNDIDELLEEEFIKRGRIGIETCIYTNKRRGKIFKLEMFYIKGKNILEAKLYLETGIIIVYSVLDSYKIKIWYMGRGVM